MCVIGLSAGLVVVVVGVTNGRGMQVSECKARIDHKQSMVLVNVQRVPVENGDVGENVLPLQIIVLRRHIPALSCLIGILVTFFPIDDIVTICRAQQRLRRQTFLQASRILLPGGCLLGRILVSSGCPRSSIVIIS
uniref:(northern house mosquito) hypothetical protein n=1 Tax=Culex pipiens TaxID=7175 RepID=A0A8D8G9X2_CULPI